MNIEPLKNGKYLATDDEGVSHVFKSVEEAQKYLWNKDESRGAVEKYKHDVKHGSLKDIGMDPEYYEWLALIEYGSVAEIEQFIFEHPLFANEYLKMYDLDETGKNASYEAVKQKGMDFIWNDDIYVNRRTGKMITGIVDGWTDIYHTMVTKKARLTKSNDPDSGLWFCDCQWGTWCNSGHRPHDGPESWGSVKIQNRFCSHAYGMYKLLHDNELWDLYATPDTANVLF